MKIIRIMYMLLGLVFLAYGITFNSVVMQILGSVFSFTVWLWEFFLHEKESRELRRRIDEGDRAVNIQRDVEGHVINNPFDMGGF